MSNKHQPDIISDLFTFFFGPFMFVFLNILGLGNSYFYSNPKNAEKKSSKKRQVILLSLGSLFYLILIMIIAINNTPKAP